MHVSAGSGVKAGLIKATLLAIPLLAASCGPSTPAATPFPTPSPTVAVATKASAPYVIPTAVPVDTLTPQELRAALQSASPPIVYDARSREEYTAGHIPGSIAMPISEMEARLAEIPRDRLVVFYCHGGT